MKRLLMLIAFAVSLAAGAQKAYKIYLTSSISQRRLPRSHRL